MDDSAVPLLDVIRTLAFVGDLAMGQPTDHSTRAAWMAGQMARDAGGDNSACARAMAVSLLRWSGCTANAPEFAQLFGDDVSGRKALLATQSTDSGFRIGTRKKGSAFLSLSQIHCEVSGDIAVQLGLDDRAQFALRHLFESYDGSGAPSGLSGDEVPVEVYFAALAGDLDVFSRLYGQERAATLIGERAGRLYPPDLVRCALVRARQWLAALDDDPSLKNGCSIEAFFAERTTSLEILAHVIDLKLPWMTGHSAQVARLARQASAQLGMDTGAQIRVYRAALIHGIGRASVPNLVWDTPGRLNTAAWERVRLAPYWTGRAARQLGSLGTEAELASYAYERADGTGYFRESRGTGFPLEARVVAASVSLVALRAARPWREGFEIARADDMLLKDAEDGRYDLGVVHALLQRAPLVGAKEPASTATGLLSERERDILRCISLGASNKVAAQKLGISPSTVRTHVESVFRKLDCSTRAAATLKATQLGLL